MIDRATIDDVYEAGSGDVEDDRWEPVSIWRRADRVDVLRLRIREVPEHTKLEGTYSIVDPSIEQDDVWPLFKRAYLTTLTMHFYRDRITTVNLERDDGRYSMWKRYASDD